MSEWWLLLIHGSRTEQVAGHKKVTWNLCKFTLFVQVSCDNTPGCLVRPYNNMGDMFAVGVYIKKNFSSAEICQDLAAPYPRIYSGSVTALLLYADIPAV